MPKQKAPCQTGGFLFTITKPRIFINCPIIVPAFSMKKIVALSLVIVIAVAAVGYLRVVKSEGLLMETKSLYLFLGAGRIVRRGKEERT